MKKLIFFLLVFGLLFSAMRIPLTRDIGPSPEGPEITINLMDNGNVYTGYFELTYFCTEPTTEAEGSNSVDERYLEFACTEGTCINTYWYYKFNPCFSGADGYFVYNFQGEERVSEHIIFEQEESYALYLDLSTGEFVTLEDQEEEDNNNGVLCPSVIILCLPLLWFVKYTETKKFSGFNYTKPTLKKPNKSIGKT